MSRCRPSPAPAPPPRPGAPLVHDDIASNISYTWALGDKGDRKAFAEADKVVELELVNQRLIATAMEPRAAMAQWDPFKEEMTLWTTSQNPNLTRVVLSAFILGVPEHKLRLIAPDVGGGFGSKIPTYPEEALVPWAARRVGRPVKWVATRSESSDVGHAGPRPRHDLQAGAQERRHHYRPARVHLGQQRRLYFAGGLADPHRVLRDPDVGAVQDSRPSMARSSGTLSNTVWVDAYRGAGRPEAAYVVERLADLAARELKMDPVEFRRKNFIPAGEFPYQTPWRWPYDSGNYQGVMDKAVEMANYERHARGPGRSARAGPPGGHWHRRLHRGQRPGAVEGGRRAGRRHRLLGKRRPAGARHRQGNGADRRARHGQGHETTFAQIVADEFGIRVDDVDVVHGDTAVISQTAWAPTAAAAPPLAAAPW